MRDISNTPDRIAKPNTFRALWKVLWPDRMPSAKLRFTFALLFLVLSKVCMVASPMAFKELIDNLGNGLITAAVMAILSYAGLRIMASFLNEARDIIFARVTQRALRDAGLRVFKHLHNLSLKYHLNRQTGGLTRVVERGTKAVETLLNFISMLILPTVVEVLLATLFMIYVFDWRYALITATIMLLYSAFTLKLTEWRIQFVKDMNKADNVAQTRAIDSLLNFETVKYFGNEQHEFSEFDSHLKSYESMAFQSRKSMSFLNFGQVVIIFTGLGLMLWLGLNEYAEKTMTLGEVVAINTYLLQLYIPLNNLGFAYREVKISSINFEEMIEILDAEPEITDQENAITEKPENTNIQFENINFGYQENRQILFDVNFHIKPGETVAIVGTTGAGKSTISKLLYRFYDPNGGRITIGGEDIKNLSQFTLRKMIAVVPQDCVLFNDTIYYNILYGRPGATQDEVFDASKRAQIHDFIMNLPDGYGTRVGERGLKLSGGEKQRIAIARALLKAPQIFIFDEATSSLDTRTEREIQENLKAVSRGHTTLIIAHRLSTIVHADQIIVLDQGKIIEHGTHKSLLETKGTYASMWQRQQQQAA